MSDTYPIRIRGGYAPDAYPRRIGVSPSESAWKLALRYVSEGGIRPISIPPPGLPDALQNRTRRHSVCPHARGRRSRGRLAARRRRARRRRDAAPREAPPPGEAATSSRTGGRRPSPQREGSWRPAPICKVRTPVRPFLLDLLFLLLDSHFPFLISRFLDLIQ